MRLTPFRDLVSYFGGTSRISEVEKVCLVHSRGSCDRVGSRSRPGPVLGRLGISPLKDPCTISDGEYGSHFLESVVRFSGEKQQGLYLCVSVSHRVSLSEEVSL